MKILLLSLTGAAAVCFSGVGCEMQPPRETKLKGPQESQPAPHAAADESEAPRFFPSGG